MKLRMDYLRDYKIYIEMEKMAGWFQLSAGYPDSSRRALITDLIHREVLARASVL